MIPEGPSMTFHDLDLTRALKNDFRPVFVLHDSPLDQNGFVQVELLRFQRELPEAVFENNEAQVPGEIVVEVQETGISGIVGANDLPFDSNRFSNMVSSQVP